MQRSRMERQERSSETIQVKFNGERCCWTSKGKKHFTITHVGSFGAFITINNFSFKLFIRPSESDAKESRKAILCLEKLISCFLSLKDVTKLVTTTIYLYYQTFDVRLNNWWNIFSTARATLSDHRSFYFIHSKLQLVKDYNERIYCSRFHMLHRGHYF